MSRVLVVDDHVCNCVPLVKLFAHARVDATWASSGRAGLAALEAFQPHVVLLDVTMPEMDGFHVLRLIRADSRYDAVAVLMYTALVDQESRTLAFLLGAQGYIAKGTAFADIRAEVERHLLAA